MILGLQPNLTSNFGDKHLYSFDRPPKFWIQNLLVTWAAASLLAAKIGSFRVITPAKCISFHPPLAEWHTRTLQALAPPQPKPASILIPSPCVVLREAINLLLQVLTGQGQNPSYTSGWFMGCAPLWLKTQQFWRLRWFLLNKFHVYPVLTVPLLSRLVSLKRAARTRHGQIIYWWKKSRIVPGSSEDFWSPFFLWVFYACRCFHIVAVSPRMLNLDLVCLIQHMVYGILSKLSFQNIIHVR